MLFNERENFDMDQDSLKGLIALSLQSLIFIIMELRSWEIVGAGEAL